MADHKISLGVDIDVSDIQSQINASAGKLDRIPIKVEIENIKELKSQIQDLGKGNKNLLTFDTSKIESSLKDVKSVIADIKTSIGSLDSGTGMKSLLSSINQISTALDKASGKFDELNAELKTLSSKDFNINLGINMGGSNPIGRNAAYGSKVRNETLPQLKQQATALENYLKEYYKVADGFNATQKLLQGTNVGNGKANLYDLLPKMFNTSGSLSSQMTAFKEYIALIKEAASIKGVNLSNVTSQFSRQADELVKDAQDIQTGAKEAEQGFEKLKQVFGGSGIDASTLSTQLDSIVVDLGEIKTTIQGLSSGISIDGLTQSFDRLSESIELLVKNCTTAKQAINDTVGGLSGSAGGTDSGVKNLNNDLKQVTVTADNTADAIDSMKNAMSSMKFNTASIDAATKDLEEMNVAIKEVTAKQGKNFDITVKGINSVGEAVEIVKRFNAETNNFEIISTKISKPFNEGAEAAKKFKKEAETVKNIKFDFEVGKYDDSLSKMDTNFNKLSSASKKLRENVEQVKNAYHEMELAMQGTGDEVADRERLIQAEKKYADALERTNNLIRIQARTEKAEADSIKLQDDRDIFKSKIDAWLTNNSAATKRFGAQLRQLRKDAETADRVQLNHLNKELQKVDRAADKAGLKMMSLGDRISTKFKEYSAYFSVAEVFMYTEQALRSMFEQVKLIDSAMTELKKVTDETDASYERFLSNAASKAKEIGTTIDGLVSSTADFARLGYDFADAQGLAEVANIYAVVGDDIDNVEQATQSLISTLTAFKDEMNGMSDSDFAMSIVDKMNEVANNYAISSGGIGDALQRSASSMMAANNTLDETIALITAANTVVQDPDAVGRLMPTIKMAISVKLQRWTRPR